jgi:hypothetical protein
VSPSKSLSVVPISVRPYQGEREDHPPFAGGDDAGGTAHRQVARVDDQVGAAAGRDSRHVLLLDHLGADRVGPDAGRVDDVVGVDLDPFARVGLDEGDAGPAAAAACDLDHLGAVQHDRAVALGLAEDGEDEADVVGLAVVEEVGVVGVARGERRDQLQHLVVADRAVAIRGPPLLVLASLGGVFLAPLAATATGPGGRHHVVHVQPDADLPVPLVLAERGDQEGRRIDEVRRQVHQQLTLQQRLPHQPEVEVLQVAEPAVDHLRGAARGADRVVIALEQSDRISPRGGIQSHPGPGDPTADHDHLEVRPRDRLKRSGTRQHRFPPHGSIGRGYRPAPYPSHLPRFPGPLGMTRSERGT